MKAELTQAAQVLQQTTQELKRQEEERGAPPPPGVAHGAEEKLLRVIEQKKKSAAPPPAPAPVEAVDGEWEHKPRAGASDRDDASQLLMGLEAQTQAELKAWQKKKLEQDSRAAKIKNWFLRKSGGETK